MANETSTPRFEDGRRPTPQGPEGFSARSLISVDDLSLTDITYLLNLADYYADYLRMGARPAQRLIGCDC